MWFCCAECIWIELLIGVAKTNDDHPNWMESNPEVKLCFLGQILMDLLVLPFSFFYFQWISRLISASGINKQTNRHLQTIHSGTTRATGQEWCSLECLAQPWLYKGLVRVHNLNFMFAAICLFVVSGWWWWWWRWWWPVLIHWICSSKLDELGPHEAAHPSIDHLGDLIRPIHWTLVHSLDAARLIIGRLAMVCIMMKRWTHQRWRWTHNIRWFEYNLIKQTPTNKDAPRQSCTKCSFSLSPILEPFVSGPIWSHKLRLVRALFNMGEQHGWQTQFDHFIQIDSVQTKFRWWKASWLSTKKNNKTAKAN